MHEKIVVRTLDRFVSHFDSIHHMPRNTIISGIDAYVDEIYRLSPLPSILTVETYPHSFTLEPSKVEIGVSTCDSPICSPERSNVSESDCYNRFEDITQENISIESHLRYESSTTASDPQ